MNRVYQREEEKKPGVSRIPINGEKQALATPIENEILSRVRIKFGRLKFSDQM
jgi:hypothetical protein